MSPPEDQFRSGSQTESISAPSSMGKMTRGRYTILVLLFVGTVINYLDRTNIAVSAPSIQHDFGLSPAELGLLFSSFAWTYVAAQIPGGLVLDRLGTKLVLPWAIMLWSIATLAQGFATGLRSFLGMRMALGLAEAPSFPANNRAVAAWFPRRERGMATGLYASGQYVGLAFLTPLLAWILTTYGWPTVFIVTGLIGMAWAVVLFRYYREPALSRNVNAAELAYIREGGGAPQNIEQSPPIRWANVRELLRHRQYWGIFLGQFSIVSSQYFFLTWFPSYLVVERHLTILRAGIYASIPYIAAFFGILVGGLISDTLLRHNVSAGVARKSPIILGLLLTATLVLANYVTDLSVVISLMGIAFFGQGMSSITWPIIADTAPPSLLGIAGGLFNLCGNLGGIVTPLVVGLIIGRTHSFEDALVFVCAIALIGAFSYIVIVGKLQKITLSTPEMSCGN